MNNHLFLFVGKSASGKSTIANIIESKHFCPQVWSYTTRPQRHADEKYHIFVSDEDFNNLGELVAYTEYNGYKYGTTADQLDKCSIYVVDVPGVETLLQNYETDRTISIIYFDSTVHTRIHRMLDRHDSDMEIISRLLEDEKNDWYKRLDSLVWHYAKLENKVVDLYQVDANKNQTEVIDQVLYYMNKYEED